MARSSQASSAEVIVLYDEQSVIDRALIGLAGKTSERQIRLARAINRSRKLIDYYIADGIKMMPGPVMFGLSLASKAAKFDFDHGVPNVLIEFIVKLRPESFNQLWDEMAVMFEYAGKGSKDV